MAGPTFNQLVKKIKDNILSDLRENHPDITLTNNKKVADSGHSFSAYVDYYLINALLDLRDEKPSVETVNTKIDEVVAKQFAANSKLRQDLHKIGIQDNIIDSVVKKHFEKFKKDYFGMQNRPKLNRNSAKRDLADKVDATKKTQGKRLQYVQLPPEDIDPARDSQRKSATKVQRQSSRRFASDEEELDFLLKDAKTDVKDYIPLEEPAVSDAKLDLDAEFDAIKIEGVDTPQTKRKEPPKVPERRPAARLSSRDLTKRDSQSNIDAQFAEINKIVQGMDNDMGSKRKQRDSTRNENDSPKKPSGRKT